MRRNGQLALSPVLIDESSDDLDDLELLTAREFPDFFEDALDLPDGARMLRKRGMLVGEEVLDANAEDLGELGEDVGARGFCAALPEGDVGL